MMLAVFLLVAQAAPPSFTIGGTVVDSITQRPVMKAKVLVSSSGPRSSPQSVITGPDGSFHFNGMPAGRYVLSAERLGYVRQTFGQRTLYARYSTAIVTGVDQTTDNLVFRLIRGGVITGKVTEPGGEPVAGMIVNVLQVAGVGKGRRISRSNIQTTDDRGMYRVGFLPRGKYLILVTGKPQQQQARVATQQIAYPTTYFPGVTNPEGTMLVEVREGQESLADVLISPHPAARLNGQMASGPPKAGSESNRYIALFQPALFGYSLFVHTSPLVNGSTFTAENVAPGRYVLSVMQDGTRRAFQSIDVTAPVTQVTINETLAAEVTVAIKGKISATAAIAVQLISLETGTIVPQRRIASSVATFDALAPGPYIARVLIDRAEAAVVSMKAQGAAITPDLAITIPETGKVDVEMMVDAAAVEIKGKLMGDNGPLAGALAMLVKRSGWSTGAYRLDQSASDGSFSWKGVPAGEYMMFAFENVDAYDYDDPAVIKQLVAGAQLVTVSGDARQTVVLSLTGTK